MAAAAPQQGVDFSGRWVLQSLVAGSEVARVMTVEQPLTRTDVRGIEMPPAYLSISIRREREAGVSAETRRIGMIGGTAGSMGPSQRTETVWEGNMLVFVDATHTGRTPRSGEWTERREEWSIGADSRLIIDVATEASHTARQSQRLVYARQ
jgi:hypothetical protein